MFRKLADATKPYTSFDVIWLHNTFLNRQTNNYSYCQKNLNASDHHIHMRYIHTAHISWEQKLLLATNHLHAGKPFHGSRERAQHLELQQHGARSMYGVWCALSYSDNGELENHPLHKSSTR